MSTQLKQTACALLLILGVLSMGSAAAQSSVVYHLDNASIQGLKGLRNIRNHLDLAPQTKTIVVTHSEGVDLQGLYASLICNFKTNTRTSSLSRKNE